MPNWQQMLENMKERMETPQSEKQGIFTYIVFNLDGNYDFASGYADIITPHELRIFRGFNAAIAIDDDTDPPAGDAYGVICDDEQVFLEVQKDRWGQDLPEELIKAARGNTEYALHWEGLIQQIGTDEAGDFLTSLKKLNAVANNGRVCIYMESMPKKATISVLRRGMEQITYR